jgi:RimJ/RimL family protein N-acetyltransferase
MSLQVGPAAGLEYLDLVTRLAQRVRRTNPARCFWEAGDFQWWWRRDQHQDANGATFWCDDDGPVAAIVWTDWGDRLEFDVVRIDDSLFDTIWPRAVEQLGGRDGAVVETIVDDDDTVLLEAIGSAGFESADEHGVATWMAAPDRPPVPPLPDGFAVVARSDTTAPHPMRGRSGEHVAEHLAECSLYRADCDLAVLAPDGEVAAYGLFWPDPVTRVGLVEPMRTEDAYQGRGLARAVLVAGLHRLAEHGCETLKVSYIVGNEASQRLYLGTGFAPGATDTMYRRVS